MGFQMAMGDLGAVYANSNTYQPGQEAELNNRIYQFKQYNDGDGNIPGLRGQICYDVVVDAANRSTAHEVTCDYTEGTVVASQEFAGVIMANVILNGEFGWVQKKGTGLTRGEFPVYMWGEAAITRTTDTYTQRIMPATVDGNSIVSAAGSEHRIFAQLYADLDGAPTAAADRYLVSIPAGQTTTAQFAVGETVEELAGGGGDGDTGVVVEVLRRGTTDYGLILSTVTADYMGSGAETITGATSGAAGVVTQDGFAIFPQNYGL